MSYDKCLEEAGAKVIIYQQFGDWQGTWCAKVEYEGKIGWIRDYFGSCSSCDAFAAEFDFESHKCLDGRSKYAGDDLNPSCPECQELGKRMAKFGKGYLEDIMTQREMEALVSKDASWDLEAQETIKFVKENAEEGAGNEMD